MKIRAISLHQPYASAMALGLKLNETRHWPTDYRGPLAIHAAKTKEWIGEWGMADGGIWQWIESLFAYHGIKKTSDFPLGCIVGVTEIFGCVPTATMMQKMLPNEVEMELGGYDEGRFAWLTRDMHRLATPVPERGRQRFWNWEVPAGIDLGPYSK